MSKSMESLDQIILGVKKIIMDIVNADRNIDFYVNEIKDDEEIATSTVMQMDSIKAIRMIVEIERRFGIYVPDEDLDMKNFKHAAAIASYISMQENKSGE